MLQANNAVAFTVANSTNITGINRFCLVLEKITSGAIGDVIFSGEFCVQWNNQYSKQRAGQAVGLEFERINGAWSHMERNL